MPEQQTVEEEPPVDEVIDMLNQGYDNNQIMESLQNSGYSNQLISEAINIATTKTSVEGISEAPSPKMRKSMLDAGDAPEPSQHEVQFSETFAPRQPSFQMPSRDIQEQIEEIAESVINEKWQRTMSELGDISSWKEKVRSELISIKQEILRMQSRFDMLQSAIAGKINDYNRSILDVSAEVKAMEKLLQNIITPLSTNVKELSRITDKLKK